MPTHAPIYPSTAPTEAERIDNAMAEELWEWRVRLEQRLALCETVFPDTEPCGRLARHLLGTLIDELGERSAALTHDAPDPDEE